MVVDSSTLAAQNANLLSQLSAGKGADSSKEDFEGMVGKATANIGKMMGVNAESLLATGLFKSFESAGFAAGMINKSAASLSSNGGFLAKLFDALKSEGMKLHDWSSGVGGGPAIEGSFRDYSLADLGNFSPPIIGGAMQQLDVGMTGGNVG